MGGPAPTTLPKSRTVPPGRSIPAAVIPPAVQPSSPRIGPVYDFVGCRRNGRAACLTVIPRPAAILRRQHVKFVVRREVERRFRIVGCAKRSCRPVVLLIFVVVIEETASDIDMRRRLFKLT